MTGYSACHGRFDCLMLFHTNGECRAKVAYYKVAMINRNINGISVKSSLCLAKEKGGN